jgi:hypothetical protein
MALSNWKAEGRNIKAESEKRCQELKSMQERVGRLCRGRREAKE